MRSIVFDSGPLISLSLNNLLWILEPMKKKYRGEFLITKSVKEECIDNPLTSKKFKYEALQILRLLEDKVLVVYDEEMLNRRTDGLLAVANTTFSAHRVDIKIAHYADLQTVAAAQLTNADALVIDEFITRNLLEKPLTIKNRLENKLHTKVDMDKSGIMKMKKEFYGLNVLRSAEIVTIAFELGIFDRYVLNVPDPKKTLLEALLWGIKLNGCSMTEQEIESILTEEGLNDA